jgi:curli biogenesis system outer membrane secretion channel CsgG
MVAAAVAGAAVVGGIASADAQRSAGNKAADAQKESAQSGIAEQQRQFDAIQALLKPYVTAGTGALTGQQDLAGLNGNGAQAAAIQALQSSPQFTSMLKQGENSILQNASATGGLRGGNTQGALAQFSPALLSATINDQYARLGGLASMGLGAATQTGNFGQAASNNVTQLLQQQGAAQAGAYLNQGKQTANMWNAASNAIGSYFGAGGKF